MNKTTKIFLYLCLTTATFLFLSQQISTQEKTQILSMSGNMSEPGNLSKTKSYASKTIQTGVEQGEIPPSRLYEYIKPSPDKEIRLSKLSDAEKQQPTNEKRLRVGATRQLESTVEDVSDGTTFAISEGNVWTIKISIEDAVQVRLHFEQMNLPYGAKVFVYSADKPDEIYTFEQTGATENGEFWTPPVDAGNVIVEYFTPGLDKLSGSNLPFQIGKVNDIYIDPLNRNKAIEKGPTDYSCHNDVPPEWANTASAVGHLQFAANTGEYVCTGTLLNPTTNDFDPILLTANHCISTQASAQSLRVYWFYNTGDYPSASLPRSDGATLLSTGTPSDHTLVRILGSIPIRTNAFFWSGWNASEVAVGTPVATIHHPSGSHKRFSTGTTISNYCPFGCAGHLGVTYQSGTTEGGSSGAGLWTGNGTNSQLVATLHGGESGCVIRDTYGKFSTTYSTISSFLQGGSDDNFDNGNGNDTRANAITIPNGSQSSLVVKHQDDDWYKISIPSGGRLTVSANFTHNYGDINMALYRGSESATVAISQSNTGTENIDYTNSSGATQDFYLSVYLYDGVRNTYNMTVTGGTTATAMPTPTPGNNNPDTAGVFRPTNGITYLRNSNTGGFADINMVYGVNGDTSIAGDWNGDGKDSLGIYRNGVFYLRNSNTTGPADNVFAFGSPGDQPIAGDWNGDGIDTIGLYRRSTGVFILRNSNTTGEPDAVFVLGNPNDIAIAGDWNGDGIDTTGVFRPSNGIIYLKNQNTSGFADIYLVYGNAGDKPLAGDWDGDGKDSIGIYRNGVMYLRNSNTQGVADIVFAFGNPGDEPIAGDWDGLP